MQAKKEDNSEATHGQQEGREHKSETRDET